jgi:hypothetical protein
VSCKSRALADAFLQAQVEFARDLIEAEAIEAPEHGQKRGGAARAPQPTAPLK